MANIAGAAISPQPTRTRDDMIVADSSVWIDFLNGRRAPQVWELRAKLGRVEKVLSSQGPHFISVLAQDRDSVFLARDLVDAFNRIGWKAKRDMTMNDLPDGLSVWPEDEVARAIGNALLIATESVVAVRNDKNLENKDSYVIGVGYKVN